MRYLPNTEADRAAMLAAVGAKSVDDLYADVPVGALLKKPLDLPSHQGEQQVEAYLGALAAENHAMDSGPSFIGAGCYNHHVPASVDYIIQRSEFLTAYTPYQPEIAQGTLTYLYEFQTYVANLTGMDIANASLYDGATALAEAVLMARRITGRSDVLLATPLNPHYQQTLETYLSNTNGQIRPGNQPDAAVACVVVQSPDFFGNIHSLESWRKACTGSGALLIHVFTEVLSLGLLPSPQQADIVVGDGQSIGVGANFGGPHLGLFACRKDFLRQMPGRLCGETVDTDGKRGFVLTLSTREQHIRREKATSNICTNVGLCALAFTVHMSLLGEEGFKGLALLNHERTCDLADALAKVPGVTVENETFFNEFVVTLPKPSHVVVEQLAAKGILAGYALDGHRLLVAATEKTTQDHITAFTSALQEVLQ